MEKELHLKVRISEMDKNKIKENAEKAGLTVSQFSRKMLIEGKIFVIDPEHKRLVANIANNVNQITKLSHQGHPIPERVIKIIEDLMLKL